MAMIDLLNQVNNLRKYIEDREKLYEEIEELNCKLETLEGYLKNYEELPAMLALAEKDLEHERKEELRERQLKMFNEGLKGLPKELLEFIADED